MTSLKQFELQKQVKENSQGLVDTINDLHKWEKDIKRTSAANCQTKKNEVSLFITNFFFVPIIFIRFIVT